MKSDPSSICVGPGAGICLVCRVPDGLDRFRFLALTLSLSHTHTLSPSLSPLLSSGLTTHTVSALFLVSLVDHKSFEILTLQVLGVE